MSNGKPKSLLPLVCGSPTAKKKKRMRVNRAIKVIN